MDLVDRALRIIHLREAISSAAVDAAEGQRIGSDMLRCMAQEADEPDQLAKMQKAYNFWMQWVDMELKETGTEEDQTQTSLYEANDASGNIGSIIRLEERALRNDGTVPIKIITPGWGTTGYYGEKVLERYGPVAFPKGTKMYWDHPTETEARERPERSLKDLAAELVNDAAYRKDGIDGPGLYASAKVFEAYKAPVDELAAHIGTSIRAYGGASEGEAEGRKGQIIESIIPSVTNSIDFVTLPGAGGQIVSIFEAARGRHDADPVIPIQEATVGDQTTTPPAATPPASPGQPEYLAAIQEAVRVANEPILQQLQEAKTENARLQEAFVLRDARDIVIGTLNRIPNVPDMTKTRLVEVLSANPPVKDGKIDTEAFNTKITEAVTAELKYLAEATGTGRVQNMGGSTEPGGNPVPLEETQKGLEAAMGRFGLSEAAAKVAASGRAN
jgi:hypothetical protein